MAIDNISQLKEADLTDTIVLTLTAATLAQAFFCISVLAVKAINSPNHLLLASLFVTICFASGGPIIETFEPEILKRFYILTLPAYLLMGPLLWFYTKWLTAERPWKMKAKDWRQFIPAALAVAVIIAEFIFTANGSWSHEEITETGAIPLLFYALIGIVHWGLFLLWPLQSVYYLILIFRRLANYRTRLKSHFASHEGRGLGWLFGFLAVLVIVWIAGLVTILAQNVGGAKIMPREVGAGLLLLLAWSLGLFGLSQRPGFEQNYTDDGEMADDQEGEATGENSEKYQRSALQSEQAERIANKIELAMERDQLYLDPTLSLNKLARHIVVSPNHISQTLNETIGDCFFDYVNGWRIRAAQPKLLADSGTVLDIALDVGFNARSSFYKAFKQETGTTPGDYRKSAARAARSAV